ncbi:hypothetical protein N231010_201 [Synechococcus phage S-CAM4]|uniref:Gp165 n=1 Tax=Synechococcus phage S-CAM4 TaxID=1883367 RepID=A0A1D8KML7_9CAUD|nr:hypothetical protein N231010_201 [Synechococcus phage S-CAM4]
MDWSNKQTPIHTNSTRSSVSVYRNLSRTWFKQPNDYSKRNRRYKHNRYYKYLLPITLLFANPSYAETVGGVSATANPVANSSGSVTNQAIQVLQGPYITNTYGGGIQCQGPTRNFTPYVTGSVSASKPFEGYYDDPVYDVTDNFGAYDADGNPMGDGILDNPGDVSFYKRTRTGQKDNYSLGVGFSMTWSTPTDKKLQDLCKEAATSNIAMMKQLTANKRLDFEIARLKNCGELKLKGIQFHPKSPYYGVCADVLVNNPPGHKHPHYHNIPSVSSSSSGRQNEAPSQHDSSDAALLGAPLQTK